MSLAPFLESARILIVDDEPDNLLILAAQLQAAGYPQGLAGEQIPLFGRITAVADVFDALTSARPYKPAWSVEQSVDAMQAESGTQFEPRIIAAFRQALPQILTIKAQYQEEKSNA